jgi:cytochrome c-type biogenesis protein CcmH
MRLSDFSLKRGLQLALLFVLVATLLGADEDSRFQNMGHKLMCMCSCNQVLLECNHVSCPVSPVMRDELVANFKRGDSDDLVLQDFVQKYGPTVLLAPPTTGFNRTVWVMPYAVLVLGIITVVLIVRSWRKRPLVLHEDAVSPVSGAELERFREQARKDTES